MEHPRGLSPEGKPLDLAQERDLTAATDFEITIGELTQALHQAENPDVGEANPQRVAELREQIAALREQQQAVLPKE